VQVHYFGKSQQDLAICAAKRALFFTKAILVCRDFPSVSSKIRFSKNGVTALALMPSL
jgi:hypothetical protein